MSQTESANPNSVNLDQLSSLEYVQLHIQEEHAVMQALKNAEKQIAQAIDLIFESFKEVDLDQEPYQGPRLFYVGAGTSGRLGVLDASECPPTFSTHPEMVQGLIAGGDFALRNAVEGAEDDEIAGEKLIQQCSINSSDVLIGISASGVAPYVISALKTARELGVTTITIANNPNAAIFRHCDQKILLETGPEILAGSTRLKAGTAQKICLNIISTGLMVKLGKTYGNLMVDLKATNTKLKKRAVNLVMTIMACDEAKALKLLEENDFQIKKVILRSR
ncbi:MAG: N-acetylmuramic acid 6-phosphate etherase [Cyanobacteria bacterium]|nr:N-acetylmuramic acid 6-phosphate etherase [Cyanobacteriota bacterium]